MPIYEIKFPLSDYDNELRFKEFYFESDSFPIKEDIIKFLESEIFIFNNYKNTDFEFYIDTYKECINILINLNDIFSIGSKGVRTIMVLTRDFGAQPFTIRRIHTHKI